MSTVGENGSDSKKKLGWWRRALIGAGIFCLLLVAFHRPLLLKSGHWLINRYARGEHLKLEFRLEGNVFSNLTIRNLHGLSTGPGEIESIDADRIHVEYSLTGLVFHGPSQLLEEFDLRSARIVLDPSKAPAQSPAKTKAKSKTSLPTAFPERIRLEDVTLIIRNQPHDLVVDHLNLNLDPRGAHELHIANLQLPQGQQWSGISAQTSYVRRDLVLRNLILGRDQFRLLDIDASKIDQGRLGIETEAELGGGTFSASIGLVQEKSSLQAKRIHLVAKNIDAAALNMYAGLPPGFIHGRIERLQIDGSGLVEVPRSWSGELNAQITNFGAGGMGFDRSTFALIARDGKAELQTAEVVQGANQFQLHGFAQLPSNPDEFARGPARLEVTGEALDLGSLTGGTQEPLTGSARLNARVRVEKGRLDAQVKLVAAKVGFRDGSVENLSGAFNASKKFAGFPDKRPWFADFQSTGSFQTGLIRFRDYALDSFTASFETAGNQLTLKQVAAVRNQNQLRLHGECELPVSLDQIAKEPATVKVSLTAPDLGNFWIADSADKIAGSLQIEGQLQWQNGLANGQVSASSANLETRDLVFHQFDVKCSVSDNTVYLNDFTALLNQNDFVRGAGMVKLHAPYEYNGKLSVNVADLSVLTPALRSLGDDKELAGSLQINWEGNGEAKRFKNSGNLKLALNNGRYGQLQSLQAKVDAAYSPDGLNVPIIFLSTNKMDFQAVAQTKDRTLEISKIQLDQAEANYAQGYVSIPFIWSNIGTGASPFPSDGNLTANFQSEKLDLRKVFADVGAKPPASGELNMNFEARGTLAKPDLQLNLELRDLRSQDLAGLEPARIELKAQAKEGQLTVAGTLQQAKIEPMQLKAELPLPLARILRDRTLPDDIPVTASLRLPRSSVNFIRQFVPAIQQLDGDAALDVGVSGTVGRPVLTGSADMTINVARFEDPTFPALQSFKARLVFNRDTLRFEQFGGELAGGNFTVSGRVTLPKLTQINLDLALKGNSALLARDDSMTVRTDADVKVKGPLNSATVTGTVALTNSHFLKNLDLIPIGLPGRPAPEPPSSRPQFSFPYPPFRNWKFDVAIKTKDPFQIRGNLANGKAIVDLHLNGTGLHPGLKGLVRLENVEATLPFSRLEIQYGFLYFDPSESLNPKIDLHGASVIRDYTVHVYVYGRSLSPQAVFTSEPPLPQEEIISLLATGATRQELTGSSNVLAGRAAMLLFQQVYRKIFKKGQTDNTHSMFERVSVEFGQVDPRTGRQTATARVKVDKHFVLVGDIEVGGDFRGMVKYLIRFH